MTDIILVQPSYGLADIMGVRAPTGLLSIAAVPHNQGYTVSLVDQRIDFNWKKTIKKHLSSGAKVVGLTTTAGENIRYMSQAATYIKSLNPDVLVFLGGSWAQTVPGMCMQEQNVDAICTGEGDYLLPEMVDYCEGKRKIESIRGIMYRTPEGALRKTPPRPLIKNLDALPRIPYHLINLKQYSAVGYRPNMPSTTLQVSRGCLFRCKFCSVSQLYGRTWRSFSVKRVIEDLQFFESKYGIRDFFFSDDSMGDNIKWFKELIAAMAKIDNDYNWGTAGIRANAITKLNDNDLKNLEKSGCKNLDIGVESGSERILQLVKKDITPDMVRLANKKLKGYPFLIKYTFMGGFPTETEEEFLQTLQFRRELMKENENTVGPVIIYTPFPGTPLYDLAVSEGFVASDKLLDWADFHYNNWYKISPSWLTKNMISLLENAAFLSYFADERMGYKYTNPLLKVLFKLYLPIGKLREDHNFYGFMIEKRMADGLAALQGRFNLFNRAQKKQLDKE